MNIIEIENAARNAWPALEERELPFGVLRYSGGVNKRANSLNLYLGARASPHTLLSKTEEFFRQRDLPAIVRIPNFAQRSRELQTLDSFLARQVYALVSPTTVMTCDLAAQQPQQSSQELLHYQRCNLQHWLVAWHELSARPQAHLHLHQRMLSGLVMPYCCLLIEDAEIQSCGMAVLSGSLVGVFGIATAEQFRGKGYATQVVRQLLQWGFGKGARYAYLQVEAFNKKAVTVYQKIGFRDSYEYWYREKQLEQLQ